MPKKEGEDSDLEEIIQEEELEEIAEEIKNNSPSEFDDAELLRFLAERESASPSLERVAVAQDEVRLERVAESALKKEEEPIRSKNYSLKDKYELNEEYSDSKREYDDNSQEVNVEVRGGVGKSLGLQEMQKKNSRDEYITPRNLKRTESGDAQKYHLRKFK